MSISKVIGLTGGIAIGKTTIANILSDMGAVVIDADKIAREIVKRGSVANGLIMKSFGKEFFYDNGEINRGKLGAHVFSNSEALKLLNSITHPIIIEEIEKRIEVLKKQRAKLIIVDAALLIELNLQSSVDEVWLVVLDKSTQIKRLMERDNLLYNDALKRINSQMDQEMKKKYADIIIDNSNNLNMIRQQLKKIVSDIIS